jgi:serine/threonine-protein kinase
MSWKHSPCVGVLAAAYAENGDFKEAIRWQNKAIEMTSIPEAKVIYENRLKLYRQNQPLRLQSRYEDK